jgi:hypothetical protein
VNDIGPHPADQVREPWLDPPQGVVASKPERSDGVDAIGANAWGEVGSDGGKIVRDDAKMNLDPQLSQLTPQAVVMRKEPFEQHQDPHGSKDYHA